jgi:hypothetical protein
MIVITDMDCNTTINYVYFDVQSMEKSETSEWGNIEVSEGTEHDVL